MHDFLTTAERSKRMSGIHSHGTQLEKKVAEMLRKLGIRLSDSALTIPGRPDFVLEQGKVVIFVDSDFWHGWQYPRWKSKLSKYWQQKIEATRARDKKNTRRIRRMGVRVIRLWEHDLNRNPNIIIDKLRPVMHSAIAKARCKPFPRRLLCHPAQFPNHSRD